MYLLLIPNLSKVNRQFFISKQYTCGVMIRSQHDTNIKILPREQLIIDASISHPLSDPMAEPEITFKQCSDIVSKFCLI